MVRKMYVCGPTVYDSSHLGHAKVYITFDVIRRVSRDNMRYIMNITDIDDKIIEKANTEKTSWRIISERYLKLFQKDMDALNVQPPDAMIKVSDCMNNIISCIETLLNKSCAYVESGSVYFDYKAYIKNGGKNAPFSTKSGEDFVLWKNKRSENEPYWDSPWGAGRPGWHIECTTMSDIYFGSQLDIHGGGIDLKFPHHNNEAVQAYGLYDYKESSKNEWCKEFLHVGHLHIDGLKMSKSLKNFITIEKMLECYSASQIRLLFLTHDWKTPMHFSFSSMDAIVKIDKQIQSFLFDDFHAEEYTLKDSVNMKALWTWLESLEYELCEHLDRLEFHKVVALIQNAIRYARIHNAVRFIHAFVKKYTMLMGLEYGVDNARQLVLLEEVKRLRLDIRECAKRTKIKELYTISDSSRERLRNKNVISND